MTGYCNVCGNTACICCGACGRPDCRCPEPVARDRRSYNALPDDPDWCGHSFVSLRTWACPDCERPATAATRARLLGAATKAPAGSVWVLEEGTQDVLGAGGEPHFWASGLYSDRARIAWLLVRHFRCGADDIRDVLRRTHWYQGAFNDMLFEGWAESDNDRGEAEAFRVHLMEIDGD